MTYGELSYRATKLYTKGKITLDKYMEMTKPLNREIEQEPKTGRWEYIQYDKPSMGNWHCSECGRIVFLLKSQKFDETPLYNYCPWCGARMESEE